MANISFKPVRWLPFVDAVKQFALPFEDEDLEDELIIDLPSDLGCWETEAQLLAATDYHDVYRSRLTDLDRKNLDQIFDWTIGYDDREKPIDCKFLSEPESIWIVLNDAKVSELCQLWNKIDREAVAAIYQESWSDNPGWYDGFEGAKDMFEHLENWIERLRFAESHQCGTVFEWSY